MDFSNTAELSVPLPGCYWVVPRLFLAGGHPGRGNELYIHNQLNVLIRAGIQSFIDLTSPHEMPDYQAALSQASSGMDVELAYYRYPITDYSVPSTEVMNQVLEEIERQNRSGRSVYLHCWGGIGRTGTIVGCYLVQHGMSGEQALQHILALRLQSKAGLQPSPETAQQKDMVLKWKS